MHVGAFVGDVLATRVKAAHGLKVAGRRCCGLVKSLRDRHAVNGPAAVNISH